jgi:hypothetical protein
MTSENVFNIVLLAATLYMAASAWGFPFRAKLLPLLMAVPAAALLLYLVLRDLFGDSEKEGNKLTEEEAGRQKKIFIYLLILLGLLLTVGLSAGLAVFLFLFVFFVGKEPWWISLALGAGMFLTVYLLFGVALHYRLFNGYILGLFL